MSEMALSIRDVHKRFGRVEALRGVSFDVPRGAFFGLFGRNGAGKTTTLAIAAGALLRDAGHVTVLGDSFGYEPATATKARLAYVAGHLSLYEWMSCAEHIRYVSQFYPSWDAAREAELLEMLEIPLDQRAATLSPGQQIQLQLLMGLAHRPELILLDEPANLDVVVRRNVMASIVGAVAEEQATVVMASHILSELDGVCDHMCVIDRGRSLASGRVDTIAEQLARGIEAEAVEGSEPGLEELFVALTERAGDEEEA